jgi:hypothetical protein
MENNALPDVRILVGDHGPSCNGCIHFRVYSDIIGPNRSCARTAIGEFIVQKRICNDEDFKRATEDDLIEYIRSLVKEYGEFECIGKPGYFAIYDNDNNPLVQAHEHLRLVEQFYMSLKTVRKCLDVVKNSL